MSGQQTPVPVASLWSGTFLFIFPPPFSRTSLSRPLPNKQTDRQTNKQTEYVLYFRHPERSLYKCFFRKFEYLSDHVLNRLCSVEGYYSCAVIVRGIRTIGTSQGNGRPKGGLVEPACTSSVRIPLRDLSGDMPGVLGPLCIYCE